MRGRADRRFPARVLKNIETSRILALRAGTKPHRFIGLWVIVTEGRVFVRSWGLKSHGWYRTLLEDPCGVIKVAGRNLPFRAVRTRSERMKYAVDHGYRTAYNTPGSLKYVRDLCRKKSRDSTIELVPLK